MNCLVMDEKIIEELRSVERDTGEAIIPTLVEMFMKKTPKILSEMRQFHARGDMRALGKLAHGLKSSSGNLGMVGFMKICGDLDMGIRQNKVSHLEADLILKQLENAYPLLLDRLHRLKAVAA